MHDDASATKSVRATRPAFLALIAGNIALTFGLWLVRLAYVGPVAAGFWRLALAIPLLALLALAGRQRIPTLGARGWIAVALAGLFFAGDLALWHVGIHHTRLVNATLLGNFASFAFPFVGYLIARTWPGRGHAIALALAAAGVMLLVGRSYELSPRYLMGDLLCIGAGLLYTFYLVAMDGVRDRIAPLPALLLSTAIGAPPLLAAALAMGDPVLPTDWTPLILLALGSQVIGQGCLIYAIGRLPALVVGLGLLTQPVMAAGIGWLVYGEAMGLVDVTGAILIAAALVLVRRPDRKTAPAVV